MSDDLSPDASAQASSRRGHVVPLACLAFLAAAALSALALLLMPRDSQVIGATARGLQAWCLGVAGGATTGWTVGAVVAVTVLLAASIVAAWRAQLADTLHRRPHDFVVAGMAAVASVGACLFALVLAGRGVAAVPSFVAAPLRAPLVLPAGRLVNQDGRAIEPAELAGRVVVYTAVYTRCGTTCPMLLADARRAIEEIQPGERADLTVVAVTLDPEHDDVAHLAEMARGRDVSAPTWRLATGKPSDVNAVLDSLGIERRRDPATGVIEHVATFVLVDRRGRVAGRIAPGERAHSWLVAALRALLRESAG